MKPFNTIAPLLESIAAISDIAFQVRRNGQVVMATSSSHARIRATDAEAAIAECDGQTQPFYLALEPDGASLSTTPLDKGPGTRDWLLALAPPHRQEDRKNAMTALLHALVDLIESHQADKKDMDDLAMALDRSYEELALYRHLQNSFSSGIPTSSGMSEIISGIREILGADMVFSYFPEAPNLNITDAGKKMQERLNTDAFAKDLINGIVTDQGALNVPYLIVNNSLKAPAFASLSKRSFRLMASPAADNDHLYGWLGAVSLNFQASFKRNHLNMLQAAASQAARACANTHLLQGLENLNDQIKTFKNELTTSLNNSTAHNATDNLNSGDFLDRAFGNLSNSIEATKALMLRSAQMATMGQLAAVFAHEIKQPVCALDGFIQIAQLKKLDSDQAEDLKNMAKAVRRIRQIIKRFDSFTRPHQQQYKPISFNSIVREVYHLMRPQLELNDIEANLNRTADLPDIMADAQGLQQAVLNLVTNAIQAMESNNGHDPELRLKTYCDGRHACLDVTDNGPGIPEALVHKVTEPYFTTKNTQLGTGLGLSVVADIVDQHNGRLEIESMPENGSRFTIKIPVHRQKN